MVADASEATFAKVCSIHTIQMHGETPVLALLKYYAVVIDRAKQRGSSSKSTLPPRMPLW